MLDIRSEEGEAVVGVVVGYGFSVELQPSLAKQDPSRWIVQLQTLIMKEW